jgi:hypothetical protein
MKKIDTNYIAAVEKAIVDKYGKNTVQDFRNEWAEDKEKEYLKQLKEKTNTEANKKRPERSSPERTCPVCKTYSFSSRDDLYMNRYLCCYDCYEDFVFSLEDKWEQGWRPDSIELEKALRRRK